MGNLELLHSRERWGSEGVRLKAPGSRVASATSGGENATRSADEDDSPEQKEDFMKINDPNKTSAAELLQEPGGPAASPVINRSSPAAEAAPE